MSFKRIIGNIHLGLGLLSGLVVFIVSLTGAFLVFEHEIRAMLPDKPASNLHVEVRDAPLLKPSEIGEILRKNTPAPQVSGVNYRKGYSSACWAWKGGKDGYDYGIRVNPYTGEVVKTQEDDPAEARFDFFGFVLHGHMHLWLPEPIGKPLVGYATLVFLVMLATGIFLWWPKGKAARKQRFGFQWKPTTGWRRKNYDLHNVLGFYMSWVALFIAITGLVMAFEWFARGWYFAISGGKSHAEPVSDITQSHRGLPTNAVDALWERFYAQNPDYDGWLEIYFPENQHDAITFRVDPAPKKAVYYRYDQYTLKDLGAGASFADKVLGQNYSIHVGEIWGLPTKFLVFFASLIAASLPVTGFLIWRGRRKAARA